MRPRLIQPPTWERRPRLSLPPSCQQLKRLLPLPTLSVHARTHAQQWGEWRVLPTEYGNWNSVYKRFARWCDHRVWERIVAYDPDLEHGISDITIVRAHSGAAGAKKRDGGRLSVGTESRRIHYQGPRRGGRLGNPLLVQLTPGQAIARKRLCCWLGDSLSALLRIGGMLDKR